MKSRIRISNYTRISTRCSGIYVFLLAKIPYLTIKNKTRRETKYLTNQLDRPILKKEPRQEISHRLWLRYTALRYEKIVTLSLKKLRNRLGGML